MTFVWRALLRISVISKALLVCQYFGKVYQQQSFSDGATRGLNFSFYHSLNTVTSFL